jgi:hypothetical protein
LTLADREAQYAAAMQVHALFGRMTDDVDRLNGLKALAASRAAALKDAKLRESVEGFTEALDAIRKKIVATTEGGAITGEERLREHLDQVYGAIVAYEGRPGDYQRARVGALEHELAAVEAEIRALTDQRLPALNQRLQKGGYPTLALVEADRLGQEVAALALWRRAVDGEASAVATREERD